MHECPQHHSPFPFPSPARAARRIIGISVVGRNCRRLFRSIERPVRDFLTRHGARPRPTVAATPISEDSPIHKRDLEPCATVQPNRDSVSLDATYCWEAQLPSWHPCCLLARPPNSATLALVPQARLETPR